MSSPPECRSNQLRPGEGHSARTLYAPPGHRRNNNNKKEKDFVFAVRIHLLLALLLSRVRRTTRQTRYRNITMGCLNSKLSEEPVASGAAAATSDGTQQKSTKSTPFRDPSMALQKVLGAVGEAVKGTSKAVGETAQGTAHHVRNVFATPLDQAAFEGYKPPVHEKTAKETSFIQESLQSNFVFENLTDKELSPLVKAFETTTVAAGKLIIEQGDDGDYFYIVKRGHCAFVVDGKKVGQAGRGASFGELALLYTCPRAATVKAVEDVQLYRVDQTTFRFILQNQTVQGEKNKGALLQGVDFLKELDPVELSKLAAVMTPKPFSEGDYLIRKGDAADYFYIVQEGTVMVTDIGVGDTAYEDLTLKAGDYVGERALVTGDPRAANAVAKTDGMAFCIDKATFDAVLGELSVLILRAQDNTKLVRALIVNTAFGFSCTVALVFSLFNPFLLHLSL